MRINRKIKKKIAKGLAHERTTIFIFYNNNLKKKKTQKIDSQKPNSPLLNLKPNSLPNLFSLIPLSHLFTINIHHPPKTQYTKKTQPIPPKTQQYLIFTLYCSLSSSHVLQNRIKNFNLGENLNLSFSIIISETKTPKSQKSKLKNKHGKHEEASESYMILKFISKSLQRQKEWSSGNFWSTPK